MDYSLLFEIEYIKEKKTKNSVYSRNLSENSVQSIKSAGKISKM
jgi:hypothetical protein